MNKRDKNIRIAIAYALASAVMLVASVGMVFSVGATGKRQTVDLLAQSCVNSFKVFGVKADIRPNDHAVVVFDSSMDSMQSRVSTLSTAVGRCSGYQLKEFCAGGGCQKPGVFLVLEPQ